MFANSKAHKNNPIHHSKELHDMLLEGYQHAIIVNCPKAKEIIEGADGEDGEKGSGGSGRKPSSAEKLKQLTPADVVYEFGKEGSFARVEGFVDKETARMAHEERLEKIAFEKYEYDRLEEERREDRRMEKRRIELLDLKEHLELNYE